MDAPYAGTLAGLASDADAGQALVFSKLAGPGWFTVAANGALSGTPLAADEEAAYFTIGVEDPLGATARATLQITVGTTPPPPVTGIELVTQLDVSGSSPLFGTTYFSGITVQAGDLLMVAHSNNKNTTTNTISLTGLGTNVVQDVNSGSSGTQSSAWVFSSAITETGTFDLALDTSNATKTVSQSTSLFVLRPTNGGSLAIASSTSNVAGLPGVTSLDLAFTMSPAVTDAFGIAAATANAVGFDSVPSGWSMEANGNDKRRTFSNAAISGTSHTATFTAATETDMALAGIVVKAVPAP